MKLDFEIRYYLDEHNSPCADITCLLAINEETEGLAAQFINPKIYFMGQRLAPCWGELSEYRSRRVRRATKSLASQEWAELIECILEFCKNQFDALSSVQAKNLALIAEQPGDIILRYGNEQSDPEVEPLVEDMED